MKKSCCICGRIHEKGEACPFKPKKAGGKRKREDKRYRDRQESAVKFRSSAAWTKKAIEIKKRDGWCCAVCLEGRYPIEEFTDGRGGIINFRQLEVHHIVKASESVEKRLDGENLITLCVDHHKMADCGEIKAGYLEELARKAERRQYE